MQPLKGPQTFCLDHSGSGIALDPQSRLASCVEKSRPNLPRTSTSEGVRHLRTILQRWHRKNPSSSRSLEGSLSCRSPRGTDQRCRVSDSRHLQTQRNASPFPIIAKSKGKNEQREARSLPRSYDTQAHPGDFTSTILTPDFGKSTQSKHDRVRSCKSLICRIVRGDLIGVKRGLVARLGGGAGKVPHVGRGPVAQNSACFGARGNGITSRMFCIPVRNIMARSKPRPNPAWGTVP